MKQERIDYNEYFIERKNQPNVFEKFNISGDTCAYIYDLKSNDISSMDTVWNHPIIIEKCQFNKLTIYNFNSNLIIDENTTINEFESFSEGRGKIIFEGKVKYNCKINGNHKNLEIKNAQIKKFDISLKDYEANINIYNSEINDINVHQGNIKSIDISGTYFNKFKINERLINNINDIQFSKNKLKQGYDGDILLKSLTIQNLYVNEGLLGALKVNNCTISNCKLSNFGTEKTNDILGFNQIVFDENTQFLEKLYIEGLSQFSNIRSFSISFQNSSFEKDVEISSCKLSAIFFDNGTFKEDVSIVYGEIDEFYIRGGNFSKELKIDSSVMLCNGLKMSGGKIEKLILGNTVNYLSKKIIFSGGVCSDMYVSIDGNRNNIDAIIFEKDFIPKNVKIIGNQSAFVQRLIFRNILFFTGTTVKLDSLSFYGIELENMANFSNIIFSGVKSTKETLSSSVLEEGQKPEYKHPTLKIHNSDLGKTTFIDCDFEEMNLDFKSSKITEVFLAGTKMPKPENVLKNTQDIPQDLINEQKRLAFGQLKKIYDNRGDTVTANEYFAREMNVYLKKKELKSPERLNVWLNKFSSNHGTSWEKAFGVTIIFSIISFAIYGCCIGLSPASWFEVKNREIFWNYFGYILEYINPIRKPDSIVEGMNTYLNKTTGLNNLKANGFPMIWDGISRIFNSYFIYQLIQAFRKHRRGS